MSKNSIIQKVEQDQLKTNVPEFSPGDTVVVQVRIKEGDRERLQAFEGVSRCAHKAGQDGGELLEACRPAFAGAESLPLLIAELLPAGLAYFCP